MFVRQEQWKSNEVKQIKSRAEYFRSYNQITRIGKSNFGETSNQPKTDYLKDYVKVRRLVTKYNPLYANQRKGNWYLFHYKKFCEVLKELVRVSPYSEANHLSPYHFFFNVVLVEKKFLQSSSLLIKKTCFFWLETPPKKREKKRFFITKHFLTKYHDQLTSNLAQKLLKKRFLQWKIDYLLKQEIEKRRKLVRLVKVSKVPAKGNAYKNPYWKKHSLFRFSLLIPCLLGEILLV